MKQARQLIRVLALVAAVPTITWGQETERLRLRLGDDVVRRFSIDVQLDSEMDLLGTPRTRTLKVRYEVSLWADGPAKSGARPIAVRFDRIEGSVTSGTTTTFSRSRGEPAGRPETVLVGETLTLTVDERCGVRSVEGLREGVSLGQLTPGLVREHVEAVFHRLPDPTPKVGTSWVGTFSVGSNGVAFALDPKWRVTAVDADGVDVRQGGRISLDMKKSTLPLMQVADQLRTEGEVLEGTAHIARADGLVAQRHTKRSLSLVAEMSMGDATVSTTQTIDVRRLADGGAEELAPPTGVERGLPAHERLAHGLGAKKADVLSSLGKPDRQGERLRGPGTFATFKTHGLIYEFDEDGRVMTLRVSVWSDHEPFDGKIHGVGLDDTIETCTEKWGEPASRRKVADYYSYETVEWHIGGVVLELEIWVEGGMGDDDREPPGHVRTMKLKR